MLRARRHAYGRNATGGVVNIITNKPIVGDDSVSGWLTGEYGNFNTTRLRGAANMPMDRQDGVSAGRPPPGSSATGSARTPTPATTSTTGTSPRPACQFRLSPNEWLDATALWEHPNESDSRSRIGKQLCIPDPGPATIGGVPTGANRNFFSQGRLPGSRDQDLGLRRGQLGGHPRRPARPTRRPVERQPQRRQAAGSRPCATSSSTIDPIYQGQQDFFQIDVNLRITEDLTIASLTSLNNNEGYSYQRSTTASSAPSALRRPGR